LIPTLRNVTSVVNDFAMTGPHKLDSISCSNASATWVTGRSKPMILWGACGSGTNAGISRAVHCPTQDLVLEAWIIGDNCSSQVMGDSLACLQNQLQALIVVFCEHLKRTKYFCHAQIKFSGFRISSKGTKTAVGSTMPYWDGAL